MSTAASKHTANQLAAMPDDGNRYELVQGELKMMSPAGGRHGRIAMRIGSLLEQHVRKNKLGEVFAAETGFLLDTDPDTVRAPDAAFVRFEVVEQLDSLDGYLPVAPDLAIEVVSPSDSSTDVEAKAQMWLERGSKLVLVVDPATSSIRCYRSRSEITVHFAGDTVDASHAVEGWKFEVADVF